MLIGIALAALGVWQLSGHDLKVPIRDPLAHDARWGPSAALGSMFGYGISYALASLSCTVGPFLAVTGIGAGGSGRGLPAVAAYTAGLTLIVGTLAVTAALAGSGVVDRLRRILPYLNRVSGALLLLVGAYVAYYGWYELRLFTSGGDGRDPVIAAAGRRQGAWPWLVALVILVFGTVGWAWRRRRAVAMNSSSTPSLQE